AYGRRVTPIAGCSSCRTKFLLFFGCSVAFGSGVKDTETVPFYASQFAPAYRAYNYGIPGYGTQQVLARLQSEKIDQEVNEKNGILIYVFIDHHVRRVIGSLDTIRWGASWPYYTLDASDNLVRKGTFTSGRPFLS